MPKSRPKRNRASKPRKKAPPKEEVWYTIRRILDERVVKGRLEYLVDWDDNISTGEAYEPSWSIEVTDLAKDEWERNKAARRRKDTEAPLDSVEDSQESQAPRPTSWRKLQRANAQTSVRQRASATTYSATPSEEPVPSITSTVSIESEAAESVAQQESPAISRAQRMIIEILKDSQFDPAEYLSASDTQTTLYSSQPIAELEDRDERLVLASQLSGRTVPDSQELSGPTWSQGQTVSSAVATEGTASLSHQAGSSSSAGSQQQEIPSHQLDPPASLHVETRHYEAAAVETQKGPGVGSSSSRVPSNTIPAEVTSPVFATQPVGRHTFRIPESSCSQISMSSSHPPAPATSSEELQPSGASIAGAGPPDAESQDAQLVSRDAFESQVDAFSRSGDISQDVLEPPSESSGPAAPSVQPETSPVVSGHDHEVPEEVPAHDAAVMENGSGRLSTAEELSQLFNLESSLHIAAATPALPEADFSSSLIGEVPRINANPPMPHSLRDVAGDAFATPNDPSSSLLMPDGAREFQHPTVSPADISKQIDVEKTVLPLMPTLPEPELTAPDAFESSREGFHLAQAQNEEVSSEASGDLAGLGQTEYVVTLPFPASLRPLYEDTLLSSRRDVTALGTIFNNEIYVEPDSLLVERIDQLLGRLDNICNYPPDAIGTVLESLPPAQLARYTCDSNAKFTFILELLQNLQKDISILIVARSVELLRLLSNLAEAAKVECVCEAIGKRKSDFPTSAARVTLVLSTEDCRQLDFDVVIGFDRSFSASRVSSRITQNHFGRKPLLLLLVTTHSIEHIDLHVPNDMSPLERKNALLSGIVRARKLVRDPDRGYPEPHELASIFVDFFNGETDAIMWEPVPLPEEVLDIYLSSQSQSQVPATSLPEPAEGRKRKHGNTDDDPVKRLRTSPPPRLSAGETEPPLPDQVQALLKSIRGVETFVKFSQMQVQIPLGVLQALAEKNAEYERRISARDLELDYKAVITGLEQRIKEYERTTNQVYGSHRKALEDRSKLAAENKKLEAMLQTAKESASKDSAKAEKRISELEAVVTRLTADPEGIDSETPLAKTNKVLMESQERVQMLEKRLENAHKDGEYVRNLYQEASSSAGATQTENEELKKQVADLQQKSDGRVRIHEIQAESSARDSTRHIRELKALVKERELELDRVREDLRQLRNGRRETRQVSVPRSPRTGMMSPRHGRAYGSSASRGTSPAPAPGSDGATLPPGNGRWAHLRD
ncbi:hypothetical protein HIM_06406 [Hirsutella minnesotensis 3608]|uniref:Chromo domain-containing protein n=1 Tax=Hirsutella minnesotensis 3608 TaxID=1043627 RepID=A0A0F7ZNQ8_9HYPO|nr:hypothetical protein HIM_06406 [Hirsutella minnesotensis 3608]